MVVTQTWKRLKCEDFHTETARRGACAQLTHFWPRQIRKSWKKLLVQNQVVDTAKRRKHNFYISPVQSFIQKPGSRPEGKLLRKRVDNKKAQQNGTGVGQRCCAPVHKAVPEGKSNVGFCDLQTKWWRHSLTQAKGFFTSMSKKQDSHSTALPNSFLNLQKDRHWTDIKWHQSLSPEITDMDNGGLIKTSQKEKEGFLLPLHGLWIRSTKRGVSHGCTFIYTDDVILIGSIHTNT